MRGNFTRENRETSQRLITERGGPVGEGDEPRVQHEIVETDLVLEGDRYAANAYRSSQFEPEWLAGSGGIGPKIGQDRRLKAEGSTKEVFMQS